MPHGLWITGRPVTEGVDIKLNRHIEQKKQEMSDCQESIVQERRSAEKLEEDIRLAQREKELALAKKRKEIDDLRARVSRSWIHLRSVSTSRVHGPSSRVSKKCTQFSGRQLGPWTRVVETDL